MPKVMMSRDTIWKLVIDGLCSDKESDRDNKMVTSFYLYYQDEEKLKMTPSNVVFRHIDLVGVQEHKMAANLRPRTPEISHSDDKRDFCWTLVEIQLKVKLN